MSNLIGGRSNQKLRTHISLVECAAQFVREGISFTVSEVADRANVGRTTAYRYFPNLEMLIAHASLYATTEVEQQSIGLAFKTAASASERLRAMVEASDKSVAEHNRLYRTMLRLSLNGGNVPKNAFPKRSGGRKELLEEALDVVRESIDKALYEKLIASLSLFLGIEADIVLRDVCLLSEEARETKAWGANAILQAAIAEAAGG
ncbi:TetR/AcrR family transcriptional regulator [Paraburkholderia aspalathi]|uniref:TetR/AcrR family transcriptional regulator n=1 Tax=Paraburkholderia aspalathi TaxID=1324617 RepID=UPI0038B8310C